jgi:hypothetical protein
MHLFWEVAEFMGNTLVFFFFGVIIAERVYDGYNPENGSEPLLNSWDWGWAIVNWVLLNVIRFVTLAMLKPFMTWTSQEPFTWHDVIVATWAGLRGAVGLSLALIVYLTSVNEVTPKMDDRCATLSLRLLIFFGVCIFSHSFQRGEWCSRNVSAPFLMQPQSKHVPLWVHKQNKWYVSGTGLRIESFCSSPREASSHDTRGGLSLPPGNE